MRRHALLDTCVCIVDLEQSYSQFILSPGRYAWAWEVVTSVSQTVQACRLHQVPLIMGAGNVNWRQKELRAPASRVPNTGPQGPVLWRGPLLVGN